ncbi:MAG: Rpn family recombination-promoting nuclease/putative transposase [Nanoarchaeota archaeon]
MPKFNNEFSLPDENNVYDKFFKNVFGNSKNVASFLKINLPEKVVENIKFDTLNRRWDSYIDNRFKEYFTDIVFHTQLKSKGEGYIVCLFEHKSTVKKQTVLQVLDYMSRIWTDLYEKGKLPFILPIVFYHGKKKWSAPRKLSGLFPGNIDWIRSAFPEFEYYLYNIEELVEQLKDITVPELRLYLKAVRMVNSESEDDFNRWLQEYKEELNEFESEDDWQWHNLILMSMWYIIMKAEFGERIIDIMTEKFPERSEEIMTVAEKLREEGKEEGRKEEKRLIAKRMLDLNEEIEKIKKVTGLSEEDIEKLKKE